MQQAQIAPDTETDPTCALIQLHESVISILINKTQSHEDEELTLI